VTYISLSSARILASCGALALLYACGGGESTAAASQTAPPPQGAVNSAPQISGQPPGTVSAGAAYSFTPTATDPNQDSLSFSIANRPAWLTFSVATGQLSGTPTASNAGTYSNISITVSDGFASATLGPFTINVQGPPRGTATLTWNAPAENTDGSPLAGLAGFWIYHGTDAVTLIRLRQINGASTTTAVLADLASGTHFFAVSALSSTGLESPLSNVARKVIP
jgi:hypothetical protein